jgi:hypothetical protein
MDPVFLGAGTTPAWTPSATPMFAFRLVHSQRPHRVCARLGFGALDSLTGPAPDPLSPGTACSSLGGPPPWRAIPTKPNAEGVLCREAGGPGVNLGMTTDDLCLDRHGGHLERAHPTPHLKVHPQHPTVGQPVMPTAHRNAHWPLLSASLRRCAALIEIDGLARNRVQGSEVCRAIERRERSGGCDLYGPHWVLVSAILRCNQSISRKESQRWSRHVPKRRSTSRMPEA